MGRGDEHAADARTPARCRTGVRMLPTTRPGPTLEAVSAEVVQQLLLSITAHHLLSFTNDLTRICPRGSSVDFLKRTLQRCRDRDRGAGRLRAEHLERGIEHRVLAGRGGGRVDRRRPARCPPVDPRLVGVSQFAVVSRKPPLSSSSWVHCWTVPLPNVFVPTSVARPRSWSAPATISDADADPPSTSTTSWIVGSVATPPGLGDRLDEGAVRVAAARRPSRRRGTGSRCRGPR